MSKTDIAQPTKNHQAPSNHYREWIEQQEPNFLFHLAAFSKQHHRLQNEPEDCRLPYKLDADRILHSKAYARYADKTQVVYLVDNDHITHRSLHVQLVSSFARGIAEILQLNTDLVEAIALGHDVGHPPFGHEGEGYLSELSVEYGNGPFCHPLQSCRLFSDIEPLNLGLAVYDGFLCHDGGMQGPILTPWFGKTWKDHEKDKQTKIQHPHTNLVPGTLEGCLVKLCDTVSYLGRDIEDAIRLGILRQEEVPQTVLGMTNEEILKAVADDMIQQSYHREFIALSEKIYQSLTILREFNFKKIYFHPRLKVESTKIQSSYRILFEWFLSDLEKHGEKSYLWRHYLCKRSDTYLKESKPVQMVIDYISGMTDGFFVRTMQKILVPQQIDLSCMP